MRKFIIFALLLFLFGCSNTKDYTFIDDMGYSVNVENPKRVCALSGSLAEAAYLAGLNVVSATSDITTERELEIDGIINVGTIKNPSLELIISSNPDFVIMSSSIAGHLEIYQSLKEMNIPAAFFECEEFSSYLNMLEILTDLSGDKAAYKTYGLDVNEKINAVLDKQLGNPSILLIRAFSTNAYAKDSNNLVGVMLKDLGCINIADSEESLLENLSMEYIMKADPDFIFVTTMGDSDKALEALAANLMNHEAWKDLKAIKNNHYFVLEKKYFHYKPNALWNVSYEKLYEMLYE